MTLRQLTAKRGTVYFVVLKFALPSTLVPMMSAPFPSIDVVPDLNLSITLPTIIIISFAMQSSRVLTRSFRGSSSTAFSSSNRLLSTALPRFAEHKDRIHPNAEEHREGQKSTSMNPDNASEADLGVGEMEGVKIKVVPLRRTGEDATTMRARLLCPYFVYALLSVLLLSKHTS
jgi:hypothetical protein